MEEYELGSDFESEAAAATIKLTSRGRHHAHSPAGTRRRSRDETKKEIQEDDEATLRELLIRYQSSSDRHTRKRHSLFTCYSFIAVLTKYETQTIRTK